MHEALNIKSIIKVINFNFQQIKVRKPVSSIVCGDILRIVTRLWVSYFFLGGKIKSSFFERESKAIWWTEFLFCVLILGVETKYDTFVEFCRAERVVLKLACAGGRILGLTVSTLCRAESSRVEPSRAEWSRVGRPSVGGPPGCCRTRLPSHHSLSVSLSALCDPLLSTGFNPISTIPSPVCSFCVYTPLKVEFSISCDSSSLSSGANVELGTRHTFNPLWP